MKKILFSILIINFLFVEISLAQGMAFGLKGGLTLGFQKWNNYERSPLPAYNGSIYIENLPEVRRFSIFGEAGYHVKGSRLTGFSYSPITNTTTRRVSDTEFHNVSLTLGVRSAYDLTEKLKAYYLLGLRGDYNISYNSDFTFLPFNDEDLNKFTYGFSFGGGFEVPFSELISSTLEFKISPDIRPQVFYPAGKYFYSDSVGNQIPVGETRVINTVFEITLGFRFLRRVEYVEE